MIYEIKNIEQNEHNINQKKPNKVLIKIAKIIRIITIPPVCATILNLVLYFKSDLVFNHWYELLIAIFTIAIIPVLAYPIQKIFKLFKAKDERTGARNLAIIFSIIGYSCGLIFSIIAKTPNFQKIIYVTYLLTGLGIAFGTFVLDIKFSGHMSGISGPIITLSYIFSYYLLFLYFFLALVMWASLYTKNHNFKEAIYGTILPVIAFIIANLIFLIV